MPALIHKKQIIGQATDTVALIKDTVGWTCKNALRNTAQTSTVSGVTFTVNEDRSISTSGTATATIVFMINDNVLLDETTTYELTGCPDNGSSSTYSLRLVDQNRYPIGHDYGEGYEFTNRGIVGAAIYINVGTNVTGFTFYPMIMKRAYKNKSYEPYHITVEEALDIIVGGTSGSVELGTMFATNWTDGVYSFESEYPFADYNIDIEPNGDILTKTQYTAWSEAGIVGSATTNTCKAMIKQPDIDIPIMIKITRKS